MVEFAKTGQMKGKNLEWAAGALSLGIIFGFALKYQHSVELFIFGRYGNHALLFLPKLIAGILFPSAAFLLFWVVAVIITWPYFHQGDNGEFLFVIPIGVRLIPPLHVVICQFPLPLVLVEPCNPWILKTFRPSSDISIHKNVVARA